MAETSGIKSSGMGINRQHRLLIVAVIIAALLVAGLTAAYLYYTQDDVYITYTYSRNIAAGLGFVFNPGEQVQGTTTPLYTLLIAAVFKLAPATTANNLTLIGNLLSAGFLLIAMWFMDRAIMHAAGRSVRAALWILWACSTLFYVSYGMETLFYCMLLAGAFYCWSRQRYAAAILCAVLLTWTRADGVVLGVTLCTAALIETRRIPWRLGLTYIAGIAPWFIFAWLYFGSPFPQTFSAKQQFLAGLTFLTDGWKWIGAFYGILGNPLVALCAALFIGVGAWVAARNRSLRLLVLWAALYAVGYTVLNVSAFWYYTPLAFVLITLLTIGAGQVGAWFSAHMPRLKRVLVIVTGLIVVGIAANWFASALRYAEPPGRVATYTRVGQWLQANTLVDSSVVVADLGIVGYHAQRRMIDSFGLIVPGLRDFTPEYAIQHYQPDYVVGTQYFLFTRFENAGWFTDTYRPIAGFAASDDDFSPMTIWIRRDKDRAEPRLVNITWPQIGTLETVQVIGNHVTWPGGTIIISSTWTDLAAPNADYSFYVHLVDETGKVVAQQDGALSNPAGGGDVRAVKFPLDLPTGTYLLRFGWYNWRTQERLLMMDGTTEYTHDYTWFDISGVP